MISPSPPSPRHNKSAFSLIEMVTVIAILVTLMTAGVSLLNGTGQQSRKTGTDMLTGLIEQARTRAITSRSNVVLAIAEPGDLPGGDERCRIGMFKIDDWPAGSTTLKGELISRWQTLNTGIVLIAGDNLLKTPLDHPELTITYGGSKNLSVNVHAIAFNSRGGLHYPFGSAPLMFRIAEGAYRNGRATPNKRGELKTISENRLKIGRVTARPYRIDG